MKTYKIANLICVANGKYEVQEGYNVHEYFEADRITDRRWATREAAETFAKDNYKGDDEYGVGVDWEIIEDELQ